MQKKLDRGHKEKKNSKTKIEIRLKKGKKINSTCQPLWKAQ